MCSEARVIQERRSRRFDRGELEPPVSSERPGGSRWKPCGAITAAHPTPAVLRRGMNCRVHHTEAIAPGKALG